MDRQNLLTPSVPDVLYHGTMRTNAKEILAGGFKRAKRPTYTGTGTCLARDIATACEYGCYQSGGCVLEVRLKQVGRYRVFDTRNLPPFAPDAYDAFLKTNALDALCNFSEGLWVLWESGAVQEMRILPKREAMHLVVEQFKMDGPNMGYNGFVGDLAVVYHNDAQGMARLRSWQIEAANAELHRIRA